MKSTKKAMSEQLNDSKFNGTRKKRTNKEDRVWSVHDEDLIEAVRKRKCLWDIHTKAKVKKNPNLVPEAWTAVQSELNERFEITEIKKRWKGLRDSFVRAHKKTNAYQVIPSDQEAAPQIEKSSFRFFEQMQFLKDSLNATPPTKSVQQPHLVFVSNNASDSGEESPCFASVTVDTSGIDSGSLKYEEFVHKSPKRKRKTSNPAKEADDVEGFLIVLGNALRRLPYGERTVLQHEIMGHVITAQQNAGVI